MSKNYVRKSRKYDEVACFDLTQISEGILDFEEIDLDFQKYSTSKSAEVLEKCPLPSKF